MRRSITFLLAVLAVFAVLALVAGCPRPSVVPEQQRARPRLVVLLVIDQLPSWAFERDLPLFTGGFARLLRTGAIVRAAEVPHANSLTAPGHATIGTGTTPDIHGVIGNRWYRRAEGRERPAEHDPAAPVFAVTEAASAQALSMTASSHALRVDGLADVLRTATGGRARSVAIGLKARAACLVAGRQPDLAVWYEAAAGGMTTSRAYAASAPPWLLDLARARPAQRFVGQAWTPLDAGVLARATGVADERAGEGDVHGLGTTFPHPIADTAAIVQTPFGDEVVLDAVHASLDAMQLGADDVPDLLAITLNAHDYVGHTFGPDSWEALDLTLRLDAALATLFETLDRRLGRDNWAVVMTSDHGVTPLVEHGGISGARRVQVKEIEDAVEQVMVSWLGPGPWVATVASGHLYVTSRWELAPAEDRDRALTAVAKVLRELPGIEAVHRVDELTGACEQRAGLERAVCHALAPGASGELFIVPARGSTITTYATGTHHDAPNDHNREVPIIVVAPGLAPQTGTGSQLQVAPTVAALLGIPPPPSSTAPPLFGLRSAVTP